MDKKKGLKKIAALRSGRDANKTADVRGSSRSGIKREIVIGANPPQDLTSEMKKRLDAMKPKPEIIERIAAHAASTKVKKKVSYDF